jgi:hypothetical protein
LFFNIFIKERREKKIIMQKKIILKLLTTLFLLIFVLFAVIFSMENTAEQYAQSLGIEKNAIKIISRLDRDNQFDELEKDFIAWLVSQNKKEQFKIAFKYAFDGEISASEMSEILSTPVSKKDVESEITSSPKSEIEYLMLDDFENKKITEENRWWLGKTKGDNVRGQQNTYIDNKCGVENNGSSLCMEYKMLTKQDPFIGHYCVAGFHVNSDKINFTEYDGVTFFIKITDITKRFGIIFWEEGDKEEFGYAFCVRCNEWTKILVPFENFESSSCNRDNEIFELSKVSDIHFEVSDTTEDPGGKGKVWIDKIALYKESKKYVLTDTSLNNIQREVIFDFEDKTESNYKNWNIGYGKQGDGTKQRVYIDSNSGTNNSNSSLCCEIIELPFGGEKSEVGSSIHLKVKNSNLSQYSGISFFVKTSCLETPIHLIFIEGQDEKEEEWFVNFNPTIEWTEVKIPFNSLEFSPVRDTVDQKLDLSEISEIFIGQWGPLSEIKEKFKIWIDEVTLYKGDKDRNLPRRLPRPQLLHRRPPQKQKACSSRSPLLPEVIR